MADSSYKGADIEAKTPGTPAIGPLAPNTSCRWSPFGSLHRWQDAVLGGSRRVVAEWSIGGADAFAQPDGTADPGYPTPVGAQVYPINDWRIIGTYRANVTPGCELRARVVYAPAGLVQKAIGPNWTTDGAWAALRIGHLWAQTPSGSATSVAYKSITMEGSDLGEWGGGEPAQGAGWWGLVRYKDIPHIRPAQFLQNPVIAARYSEWAYVNLTIEVQGGARPLHVIVYEHPLSHVQEHDDDGLKSAHAAPAGNAPMTLVPMTKAVDGTTYEEHRHGVTQTMQVAERQSERLGPRILHVTSWRESDATIWDQAEQNPFTTASASFEDIKGTGITTYDEENPGWIVAGSNAKLHRLCDPNLIMRGGVAAVVPVRVRVDASRSAGTGTLRVQSGPYEWVDVSITGTRAWYTAVGYLKSQVYGDHHEANVMIFVLCSGGGTLSVYNVCVDYGAWTL
jgi:hypothetical protein